MKILAKCITILLVISTLHSTAQQESIFEEEITQTANLSHESTGRCVTDQALENRLQDPIYAKYREDIAKKINANKLKNIPCNVQNTVIIPVAVHFDNAYTCENTQCLIDATTAQIQSLNDDFAASNADLAKYNEILANCGGTNVASDGVCVTFCLATQNHPTSSGITEGLPAITIGQYSGGFGAGENGAPEWVGYLNMFVVDGFNGGVADGIPGALDGDGVTQDGGVWGGPGFAACSSGGALNDDANWNLGRTLTHEVGHYLGLYHTFQGGCSDEPNSPYDINDTPAQTDASIGCVATNDCNALATGCTGGQEVQFNYMDYFDDACLVMFSNEQAIAMNTFVNSVSWAQATTACANGSESIAACNGGGGTTCDDNIQNGDETGIDCGGSCDNLCPCDANPVAITINLDNYPQETSWSITNTSGAIVASGGNYDGSTATENLCLVDDCYTFTINDTYGDGICCGFGNGSYSVADADGNVLASGGEFESSESTNFCLDSGGGGGCDEGTACDDGDACTTGETYNVDCDCVGGTFQDTDDDGVCDANDVCPEVDDSIIGTSCNDGDDCTTGETYGADCNCTGGIFQDTDDDGVCDANDACPNLDDALIGTSCDDGDVCTTDETYDADCNCTGGTFQDTDDDGTCDAQDTCPNDPSNSCNVDYCDAQSTNTNYEFIQSVELNGETNDSGNDGGYGDYTGTTLVALSNTNAIVLTPGFVNSTYAENWSIWIDFNKDGDFDDEDEQVYTGISSNTTPLTGTFSASSGTGITTMRIVMAWNGDPAPCGSFQYGEVEDYTVALSALCTPGTACDDNNDCTAGETYDANCNCTGGTLVDSDNDGICDSDDACPELDDTLIGTACDDNDPCTAGETYDANCNCTGGTLVDSDNDGICDSDDACPELDDTLIGAACDDNDPCTAGETYDANCNCTGGTFQDDDNDGVCNTDDICPGGDDSIDSDGNGIPDFCDTGGCTPGESCNDNNSNTIQDTIDANCECVGQAITPCVNGLSGGYPCNDIDLVGFMSISDMGCQEANDIWGWTDPQTGKEYAIFGCLDRTTFIDISSPTNPVLIGSLPTNTVASNWRDMKVYDDHAFIVSEAGGHGMQVFDLTQLRSVNNPPVSFSADAVLTNLGGGLNLSNSHNIVINEESGYAYAVGSNTCSGGLTVININNPTSPVFEACFSTDGYTHDAQCVNYIGPDGQYTGQEICFNSNENTLTIVDVTDKSDMSQISRTGYAGQRYTHQGWLTEDHEYFLMNDELDESNNGHNTRTHIWDVRDLDSPIYLGFYEAAVASIDHNLYIKGDLAYMANYRSGLRIVDISNVENANLEEVAYFDTYPASNSANFNSAWSNYPYFESGYIIISDIEQGLFIVRHNPDGGGGCTDSDNDGLCDDDDPCPNDPTNTCDDGAPTYCDASASNSDYEYIQQVVFGNIDNTSGNNGGYGDFTSQVADVGLGDAVPLGLTPEFTSSTYNETWTVWIDFNRDGDFDDAGEALYSGTSSGTLSGSVIIPNTASIGLTGMRVAMQWNNPAATCGTFTYGEVEDYTVNITAAPQNYNANLPRNEEGLSVESSLRIYPNPASDELNVRLDMSGTQEINVTIFSLDGKQIYENRTSSTNILNINIQDLPNQSYILRLQTDDGKIFTDKFLKL